VAVAASTASVTVFVLGAVLTGVDDLLE